MNLMEELAYRFTESHMWTKELIVQRHDFLTTKGQVDTNIYYIQKGSMRVFIEGDDQEHTIRFGYAHNFSPPMPIWSCGTR
jgi:CRP-like cAMP-binding protein